MITELANYIEYLNEYKNEGYRIEDLTEVQETIGDPMQSYEYLASVNVENKDGLINSVIDSGRVKFMYYVYEYVPGLNDEERSIIKESIVSKDTSEKYKQMVEDTNGVLEEEKYVGDE